MAKYIDAEAVKGAVRNAVDNGIASTLYDLEEIIDALPAADVGPVRHGRWEYVTNVSKTRGWFACSKCGSSPPYKASWIRDTKATYCPSCGAKMDGEEVEP